MCAVNLERLLVALKSLRKKSARLILRFWQESPNCGKVYRLSVAPLHGRGPLKIAQRTGPPMPVVDSCLLSKFMVAVNFGIGAESAVLKSTNSVNFMWQLVWARLNVCWKLWTLQHFEFYFQPHLRPNEGTKLIFYLLKSSFNLTKSLFVLKLCLNMNINKKIAVHTIIANFFSCTSSVLKLEHTSYQIKFVS